MWGLGSRCVLSGSYSLLVGSCQNIPWHGQLLIGPALLVCILMEAWILRMSLLCQHSSAPTASRSLCFSFAALGQAGQKHASGASAGVCLLGHQLSPCQMGNCTEASIVKKHDVLWNVWISELAFKNVFSNSNPHSKPYTPYVWMLWKWECVL